MRQFLTVLYGFAPVFATTLAILCAGMMLTVYQIQKVVKKASRVVAFKRF